MDGFCCADGYGDAREGKDFHSQPLSRGTGISSAPVRVCILLDGIVKYVVCRNVGIGSGRY